MSDDVLGAGIVSSLSHPGGMTTGITILSPELNAKRLDVLKELIPGLSRVAALWDVSAAPSQVTATENAARLLNVKLQILEVRRGPIIADPMRLKQILRSSAAVPLRPSTASP
jgi:putative tryptophan/tyrosine transport system substrate-binding protein